MATCSEQNEFKVCLLTYRCLHGLGPNYLTRDLQRVADVPSRRQSSTTYVLLVLATRQRPVTSGRGCESLEITAWRSDISSDIVSFSAAP